MFGSLTRLRLFRVEADVGRWCKKVRSTLVPTYSTSRCCVGRQSNLRSQWAGIRSLRFLLWQVITSAPEKRRASEKRLSLASLSVNNRLCLRHQVLSQRARSRKFHFSLFWHCRASDHSDLLIIPFELSTFVLVLFFFLSFFLAYFDQH